MIHLLLGRSGMGKTSLIRSLIPNPMPRKTLIADPRGNFSDFGLSGARLFPRLTVEILSEKNALIVADDLRAQLVDDNFCKVLTKHLGDSRQNGQDIILSAWRPFGITREAPELAGWIYAFQSIGDSDLRFYAGLPGVKSDTVERIKVLPIGHFIPIRL